MNGYYKWKQKGNNKINVKTWDSRIWFGLNFRRIVPMAGFCDNVYEDSDKI